MREYRKIAQTYTVLRSLQSQGSWPILKDIDFTTGTSAFHVFGKLESLLKVFDCKQSSKIGNYTQALQHILLFLNKDTESSEARVQNFTNFNKCSLPKTRLTRRRTVVPAQFTLIKVQMYADGLNAF